MTVRILVVDDERPVTRACVKILQRAGYETLARNSSLEALSLLEQETFDLLLTDVRMPDLNGMDLLTAAKGLDPHLSVVVITGYGTMDDAVTAIRLGAQGFLLKPYDPDELLAVIQENLQHRALLRDSFRLQTLLPLLKLNDTLQEDRGAALITEQALQVAAKELASGRLQLWLKQPRGRLRRLTQIDLSPDLPAQFLPGDLEQVLFSGLPLWKNEAGLLNHAPIEPRQAVAVALPLLVKGEGLGVLVAVTPPQAPPLTHYQLDLLQLLSSQLGIVLANINLFNRVETLRAFNENIIENMNTGLIALDENGRITVFNKVASDLLDIQAQAMLGRPIKEALAPVPRLARVLLEPLTGLPITFHQELQIERWQKERLIVNVTASPLYDTDHTLSGVVGLIDDLSELKALEAESRRLDRLAALGEMSAVVAHELRNPIAGIAAGVEYLTKNLDPNSAEYQGSRMIRKEIERVHRIVEDILQVARPLELHKAPVSLQTIIDAIWQRHKATLDAARIAVRIGRLDSLPELVIDGQRMEQVFDNLLSNAIHAMPEGGTLTLSAAPTPDRRNLVIVVKDNGAGIDQAVQQKIFEPFFTTKSRGVGLGLALSRRIMEAHGGSLTILSSGPKGTVFELRLPLTGRLTSSREGV